MKYIYEVGDIVQLKKKHPCGSTEWQILRVGADFKLKCNNGITHNGRKKYKKFKKGL